MEDYSHIQGSDFSHVEKRPNKENLFTGIASAIEAFKGVKSGRALRDGDVDSKWLNNKDAETLRLREIDNQKLQMVKESHSADLKNKEADTKYKNASAIDRLRGEKKSSSSSKTIDKRAERIYKNLDKSFEDILAMESKRDFDGNMTPMSGDDLSAIKNSPQYQSMKLRAASMVKELQALGLPVNEEYLKFVDDEIQPPTSPNTDDGKPQATQEDPLAKAIQNRSGGIKAAREKMNGKPGGGNSPLLSNNVTQTKSPLGQTVGGALSSVGGAYDLTKEGITKGVKSFGDSVKGVDPKIRKIAINESMITNPKEADGLVNAITHVSKDPKSTESVKKVEEMWRMKEKLSPAGQIFLLKIMKENPDIYPMGGQIGELPDLPELKEIEGGAMPLFNLMKNSANKNIQGMREVGVLPF